MIDSGRANQLIICPYANNPFIQTIFRTSIIDDDILTILSIQDTHFNFIAELIFKKFETYFKEFSNLPSLDSNCSFNNMNYS
jgi:hypothetical protein